MTAQPPDARRELAELGQRRAARDEEDKELAEEIRAVLARAPDEGVTVSEAARLLGVHRTTLYRVYGA